MVLLHVLVFSIGPKLQILNINIFQKYVFMENAGINIKYDSLPEVDSNISETAIFAAINSQFCIRFSRFTSSSNRLKSLL